MTLSNFKKNFNAIFWRDAKHDDERIYTTMILAANEMLSGFEILEFAEIDDAGFTPFRWLDDKYFIREFNTPNNANALIDFKDMRLINALMYKVASMLSLDHGAEFKVRYFRYINEYMNSVNDESCRDLETLLDKNGLKKPYRIEKSLFGAVYIWDEGFISALDYFIADTKRARNTSYEKFILDFIDYQNGLNNRADMIALDEEMSKKLLG